MVEISKQEKNKESDLNLLDLINNLVYSKNHDEIGKVQTIYLDVTGHNLEGISLKTNIFSGDFIGEEFIDSVDDKKVVLKFEPHKYFKGLRVYDKNNQKIGIVKKFKRIKGEVVLTVERGLTENEISITGKEIDRIGKKVNLSCTLKELKSR